MAENSHVQQKGKKSLKNEGGLRVLWENIKHYNTGITGIPEEEKRQRIKNSFEEKITENFPNQVTYKPRKHGVLPHKMNPQRPACRHIVIKMLQVKDKKES